MSGAKSEISGIRPAFRWWPPFYQWHARRRLVVAGVISVMTWILACGAWTIAGSGGARGREMALADAKQRLANAQRQITGLPALRKATQTEISTSPRSNTHPASAARAVNPADDIRFLSQLATKTGLTLLSLEPGAENRKGSPAGRFLKLTAQTDFAHLNDFFRQMPALPMLVVPAEVTIRHEGDILSMAAVFQLFDELRAPAPAPESVAPEHYAGKLIDPFIPPSGDAPGSRALRLAGVIEDGTHAIALMQTPDGMQTVKRGDVLGGERVARIGMPEIVLSRGTAMRALTWDDQDEKNQNQNRKKGGEQK